MSNSISVCVFEVGDRADFSSSSSSSLQSWTSLIQQLQTDCAVKG
jgi:hypothetical protein